MSYYKGYYGTGYAPVEISRDQAAAMLSEGEEEGVGDMMMIMVEKENLNLHGSQRLMNHGRILHFLQLHYLIKLLKHQDKLQNPLCQ